MGELNPFIRSQSAVCNERHAALAVDVRYALRLRWRKPPAARSLALNRYKTPYVVVALEVASSRVRRLDVAAGSPSPIVKQPVFMRCSFSPVAFITVFTCWITALSGMSFSSISRPSACR